MNESRDKFLTESFLGKCWHSVVTNGLGDHVCALCHEMYPRFIDFSTWPSFGILWQAAKEDEEWDQFLWNVGHGTGEARFSHPFIHINNIDPDTFATKWAKFKGWKEAE